MNLILLNFGCRMGSIRDNWVLWKIVLVVIFGRPMNKSWSFCPMILPEGALQPWPGFLICRQAA